MSLRVHNSVEPWHAKIVFFFARVFFLFACVVVIVGFPPQPQCVARLFRYTHARIHTTPPHMPQEGFSSMKCGSELQQGLHEEQMHVRRRQAGREVGGGLMCAEVSPLEWRAEDRTSEAMPGETES